MPERLRLSVESHALCPSGKERICDPDYSGVLVEDEELIGQWFEEALSEGGFAVTMASTGSEAMALLDREGAEFGALITDVNLPGNVTGRDVAKRARELNDRLPVTYITGASAHDWASKVCQTGNC